MFLSTLVLEPYLNKVLIYLKPALPEEYRTNIQVSGGKMVISIPGAGNFDQIYEALHPAIVACIGRIRGGEMDLEFTIRSHSQERGFTVPK
jgi:hypothetical protein